MKTIVFDENSMNWTSNPDLNIEYLKAKRAYIFTMFDLRGYRYEPVEDGRILIRIS